MLCFKHIEITKEFLLKMFKLQVSSTSLACLNSSAHTYDSTALIREYDSGAQEPPFS